MPERAPEERFLKIHRNPIALPPFVDPLKNDATGKAGILNVLRSPGQGLTLLDRIQSTMVHTIIVEMSNADAR